MLTSMPDPGPMTDLPFNRAQFDLALHQARQMVAGELEESLDPDYDDQEKFEFRRIAYAQRCAIAAFARLVGDTSDDLGAPGDPTPEQVRAWGVTA
ncbi:hypothetical protein [Candidatus Frankia nodulisporulans]|uniref:hypothetical protein n=1 Tax=Candidatus Frankia nodulisporulans TaxID=2060052 RepID=UPI0013CFABC3|nr:hypothetical protein [Candidatus Frankia nodulisporulans]